MYNNDPVESSNAKWQSFLEGDDNAYAWLYSQYVQQLYQYGCRFTTDTEMVKDCVQDVFVNIYRQKGKYSSPLSPRQREIIYYRFFEGLDYSSICELMGLNYQSAYNLLQRSLTRLREMYGILPFFFLF